MDPQQTNVPLVATFHPPQRFNRSFREPRAQLLEPAVDLRVSWKVSTWTDLFDNSSSTELSDQLRALWGEPDAEIVKLQAVEQGTNPSEMSNKNATRGSWHRY